MVTVEIGFVSERKVSVKENGVQNGGFALTWFLLRLRTISNDAQSGSLQPVHHFECKIFACI
jgi:hypothetical protein